MEKKTDDSRGTSAAIQQPRPSLGRVVLYAGPDGPEMAHVCKVWSDTAVNLDVVSASGEHRPQTSVLQGTEPGQWSWPPRI